MIWVSNSLSLLHNCTELSLCSEKAFCSAHPFPMALLSGAQSCGRPAQELSHHDILILLLGPLPQHTPSPGMQHTLTSHPCNTLQRFSRQSTISKVQWKVALCVSPPAWGYLEIPADCHCGSHACVLPSACPHMNTRYHLDMLLLMCIDHRR